MAADMLPNTPHVPVSWGELLDKITILEIKTERLASQDARANAAKELALLHEIAQPALANGQAAALVGRLKLLNLALWDIEDRIRDYERAGDFGPGFVELARSVYRRNDERGAIKREINLTLGSALIEEKSYKPY
jgi:hypothetical protein